MANNTNKNVAIRKRQQIISANKMMFIWVAVASIVVGFSIVVSAFMVQKAIFNEKVLAEKLTTVNNLTHNNKIIGELESKVRIMNTNQSLIDSKANSSEQPIQVILDALPSEANSTALGSSLQQKLIPGTDIKVESFTIDTVSGVENNPAGSSQSSSANSSSDSTNQINFNFSVSVPSTNPTALKDLLLRLEKSIRAIDLQSITIESQASKIVLSVDGSAYYNPSQTVELKDITVKP